eukprot:CAMPEP_0170461026 /NCGR_PEP_ID=MMETSP0123-20130129/7112_1 /TAXON_ID=182087 /ORGANISM="Favella ehrenbergii, Strain Fehren 1" /LENGTH=122 /DNA_ID=CAMNT_0010725995 /DNA_START=475 /DNA_END=843 /DNA_ORIENTATION=-
MEVGRELLHFRLLLTHAEGEAEAVNDGYLCGAFDKDFGLRSQETLLDRVNEIDSQECLEGDIAEVRIELRGEDLVERGLHLKLTVLVKNVSEPFSHLLQVLDRHHDRLLGDLDMTCFFESGL